MKRSCCKLYRNTEWVYSLRDGWLSIVSWSCIFHPCTLVPHIPLLHFQPSQAYYFFYSARATFLTQRRRLGLYMTSKYKVWIYDLQPDCSGPIHKSRKFQKSQQYLSVCNFILVVTSNLGYIVPQFREIAVFCSWLQPYYTRILGILPLHQFDFVAVCPSQNLTLIGRDVIFEVFGV